MKDVTEMNNMMRIRRGKVMIKPCSKCRGRGFTDDDKQCDKCHGSGEEVEK